MTFPDILKLLEDDLQAVERAIQGNFTSDVSLIPIIGRYLSQGGGKRIRPVLVLISSKLCGYQGGNRHILYSCIVEFIHTATLLHDDVVDGADRRRGNPSANSKWGNEASVLVGDFLFSKSFALMTNDGDQRTLDAMSDTTLKLAEGEVLELVKTCDVETAENEYLDVAFRKTAALISTCCRLGALLAKASSEREKALLDFGTHVGLAFQLVDDALDYIASEERLGKPVGKDLQEGHVTLPLIHTYGKATARERDEIRDIVAADVISEPHLKRILGLIEKYGGIDYTMSRARDLVAQAKQELAIFEDSCYLQALRTVADYIVERDQ
ncbi:MAG TPA: polyprenyl synthetase family protein [bacterium]|nr:polyprenyl synthetase family protein [bacterium]